MRRVSALTGIADRKKIERILVERGVEIRNRWKAVDWVDAEHIRCGACQETKAETDFRQTRTTTPTDDRPFQYLSFCTKCKSKKNTEWRNRGASAWTERCYRTKRRAREHGVAYSLTPADLAQMFDDQSGRCFYTDLEMKISFGDGVRPDSVSIDRVYSDGPYSVENVVLCQTRINSVKLNLTLDEMKLWTPEWYRRLEVAGKIRGPV